MRTPRYRSALRRIPLGTAAFLLALIVNPAAAQRLAEPGTPASVSSTADQQSSVMGGGLAVFYNQSGFISWSIDGVTNANVASDLAVEKPAGATVRDAFLVSACVWTFPPIVDGDVVLNGTPVDYSLFAPGASGTQNCNALANVTTVVKPLIDAAPAGLVPISYSEVRDLDGSGLIVVYNDPNQTEVQTVSLLFGVQSTTGDSFAITLGEPFDPSSQSIVMSLAISFGFQVSANNQRSIIDVNGERLTSSAGGQDDCEAPCGNGGLFTIGGVGDSEANPPDPNSPPTGSPLYRYDDELYTLNDLIETGETSISVFTQNPSNDDNILFAGFLVRGAVAIVGEGIILGPPSATNPVGASHTVTARLADNEGAPIEGRNVDFEILSGPHMGMTGSDITDAAGEATFTYVGTTAGTDVIVARFLDSEDQEQTSNEVTKTWVDEGAVSCANALLRITGLDADGAPDGEYVEVTNDEGEEVDLSQCSFATFDPFTEDITYSVNLGGTFDDGDTYFLAQLGYSGPETPDQMFPAMTIPDGPGAVAILGIPAPAVGTDVTAVSGDVVAAIVYFDEDNYFGQVPGPATAARSDFQALLQGIAGSVSADAGTAGIPAEVSLAGAFPNPARGVFSVRYGLPDAADVRVVVYDVLGREAAVLYNGRAGAGWHDVPVSDVLAAGVYVVRLEAAGTAATQRVTVIR